METDVPQWKTLRVIVEIRVPPKSRITENIFAWALRDLVENERLGWPATWTPTDIGAHTTPKVKQYSKVQGYESLQLRRRIKQHG
jgi:hypothetical protein